MWQAGPCSRVKSQWEANVELRVPENQHQFRLPKLELACQADRPFVIGEVLSSLAIGRPASGRPQISTRFKMADQNSHDTSGLRLLAGGVTADMPEPGSSKQPL